MGCGTTVRWSNRSWSRGCATIPPSTTIALSCRCPRSVLGDVVDPRDRRGGAPRPGHDPVLGRGGRSGGVPEPGQCGSTPSPRAPVALVGQDRYARGDGPVQGGQDGGVRRRRQRRAGPAFGTPSSRRRCRVPSGIGARTPGLAPMRTTHIPALPRRSPTRASASGERGSLNLQVQLEGSGRPTGPGAYAHG